MTEAHYLYPRLPSTVAQEMAVLASRDDVTTLIVRSSLEHEAAIYGTTGGNRAPRQRLEMLREEISNIAEKMGFPGRPSQDQARQFDASCTEVLHQKMCVSAHEASQHGVWQFLCCVVMPDIVRWRFPGGEMGTSQQRYLGGVRNALGRLWWRGLILADSKADTPYYLIRALNEDELVQIMERPTLAGNLILSRSVALRFLEIVKEKAISGKALKNRMLLMREAQKRLMRLFPLIAFDLLDEKTIRKIVNAQLLEALSSMQQKQLPAGELPVVSYLA